jgi:hypothetical protein
MRVSGNLKSETVIESLRTEPAKTITVFGTHRIDSVHTQNLYDAYGLPPVSMFNEKAKSRKEPSHHESSSSEEEGYTSVHNSSEHGSIPESFTDREVAKQKDIVEKPYSDG